MTNHYEKLLRISPGETHLRRCGVMDGDLLSFRMHLDCELGGAL